LVEKAGAGTTGVSTGTRAAASTGTVACNHGDNDANQLNFDDTGIHDNHAASNSCAIPTSARYAPDHAANS